MSTIGQHINTSLQITTK